VFVHLKLCLIVLIRLWSSESILIMSSSI